jgi:predicted dehydrogenase
MTKQTIRVAINGTGFAADYTAKTYGMIPHRNGVEIELAGVVSGRRENAESFAASHNVSAAFESHAEMLEAVKPTIDNVCCANFAHGPYTMEAARAGVPVIVLEKPPVIWPGYAEGRQADAVSRRSFRRRP